MSCQNDFEFAVGEIPTQHSLSNRIRNRTFVVASLDRKFGKLASSLHILRIVQRDQSLQWCVRPFATNCADFTVRCTERFETRRRCHAFPECIQRTSIQIFAAVLTVFTCVAAGQTDHVPDVDWLVGTNAGTEHFLRSQAADGQSVVSDHFRIHPKSRTA